ncbi:MAG: EF-hand domain-containing protein [Pirellulaceae bacterium]|nr:EF-hand domain-containing protein [Pirellulaceae bacterium]
MVNAVGGGAGYPQMARQIRTERPDFSKVDADNSGGVSKAEFKSALESKGGPGKADRAEEIFNKIDADQDGQISEQEHATALEMREQMSQLGGMRGSHDMQGIREQIMQKIDADGDGTISEAERAAGKEKMMEMRAARQASRNAEGSETDPVQSLLEMLEENESEESSSDDDFSEKLRTLMRERYSLQINSPNSLIELTA